MNEIGLDPGIDHIYGRFISIYIQLFVKADRSFCLAVKMIDEVHKAGGKITSFLSYW